MSCAVRFCRCARTWPPFVVPAALFSVRPQGNHVGSDVRQEEDRHGRRALRPRPGPDPRERLAHSACRAVHPAVQGVRARPRPRRGQVRARRHPRARLGRWPHLAGVRHPPGHRQGHRRLLRQELRRRLGPRAQEDARRVRPHPPRCRPPPLRAEEVRWSRCPCASPEVLPLNVCVALAGVFPVLPSFILFLMALCCDTHVSTSPPYALRLCRTELRA